MFRTILNHALDILFPPSCRLCNADGAWMCARCLGQLRPLIVPNPVHGVASLLCLGRYDDSRLLHSAIQQLKYRGGQVLAQPFAHMLASEFSGNLTGGTIIPVPLHRSRERARGFNQSLLLARHIGLFCHIPVSSMVVRTRATVPQVTLKERDRLVNVRDAFALRKPVEKVPQRGIIVDDVFTTGATIAEVARVLHNAGMERVTALTIAKG